MLRGRTTALTIRLTPAERRTLGAWQRATTNPAGLARRGRMILRVADGMPLTEVATTVGISRRFVDKWVQRLLQAGIEGLANTPRRDTRRVPQQAARVAEPDRDRARRTRAAC